MAHVTVGDVQVYLDVNKLALPENDPLEEDQTFADIVFASVGQVYDFSSWTNETTTPALIRRVLAMLIAANRYNKIYSEEDDAGNRYADKIEARALEILASISDGTILLYDASLLPLPETHDPSFYPNDATGASIIYDALGFVVGEAGSEDIKFRMATTW
jgi:hypothetical protein